MESSRKRRNPKEWFKDLSKPKKALLITAFILLVLMLALVIYVASKFSKLDTQEIAEEDLYIKEIETNQVEKDDEDEEEIQGSDLGTGYTNFVLFGGDSRTGKVDGAINTDSIIIFSLNNETKKVNMVSVYRDTLLDNSTGYIAKANSAYASGGPARAMSMLNKNLDLDIKKYVTVDFGVVADVIDELGGIYVNISEAEKNAMNKYIKETAKAAGKKAVLIEETGYQHVDGVQATTYARIRKGVGDDYARTERQREVIEKVLLQVIHSDLTTINNIIDDTLPRISTNFSLGEILKYAMNFASYDIEESTGFPFTKGSRNISGRGSSVYAITLESNVTELHKLLFAKEDYEPSAEVKSISYTIDRLVASSYYKPTTPVAPETTTPSTPETSETPSTPETPETSVTPSTPEVPETTTPSTPETPETPETPSTPEVPETTTPSTPEATTPETTTPETTTPETTTPETTTPETGAATSGETVAQ